MTKKAKKAKPPRPLELRVRTFETKIPVSRKTGIAMDHLGLIVYPHDRESCSGCAVNRAIVEERRKALREFAEKLDRQFIGKE